jgi:serine/threonine-protein kinase
VDRESLRRAEEIFASAVARTGDDRRHFLDEVCAGDVELRAFVDLLLASDDRLKTGVSAAGISGIRLDDEELNWPAGRIVASRFRIVRTIGAGAAGRVYEATDERLGRSVALKVLRAGTLTGSRQRRRLERETLALSQLDHGHIASLFDVVVEDGLDVLVMEYVAGGTVRDRLRDGALPIHEVETFAAELMEALAAAHGKGIVHGDLKPENLGISEYGKLKVLDFGLAVILEEESSPAEPGASLTRFVGTPAYMSPEQFLG